MKFDKFWTNLELHLTNLGRYLPVFRSVFLVFSKTGFFAAYRYFFPSEKKNPWFGCRRSPAPVAGPNPRRWHTPSRPKSSSR
jgi:hypothetical protein